jgi:filamentous hemagglutinin family protein
MDRSLLLCTALRTGVVLAFTLPAHAQVAPNARPVGGSVVAGTATISQRPNTTTIDQSTQRAAINWQSFNIGSQQSVQFQQPSSSAVALNRVIGPNPSQIAGRIDANGQVIITNQSGVVFYKGSQVNTAGLMVSAAGITNANFMAGKMVFDQAAKPNAMVSNQGKITVRDAGLAALVAPQVANSGVINARLGHVVLAGARTATLDLYGDGLMSIDVTGQVVQAPSGATALVTNTGVIRADGGTVQLTAQAADGVVQTLVSAGGKIRANTVDGHTGTIVLNGVGGSITVAGQLTAAGTAPGSTGGNIAVAPSGSVGIAGTARIDASGQAGGGVVAIGTTLARAKGGPSVTARRSANVTMAAGATITASATATGNGGRVAVLSAGTTTFNGAISAKGGPQGGNGGFVETSGQTLMLGPAEAVDTSAPHGVTGMWLEDPTNFVIANSGGDETPAQVVNALASNQVTIQADNDITVTDPIDATTNSDASSSLILEAGRSIAINANITMNGGFFEAIANDSGDLGTGLADRSAGIGSVTMAPGATVSTSVSSESIFIDVGGFAKNTSTGGDFQPGTITLGNLNAGVSGGNVFASGGTGITALGTIVAGTASLDATGAGGVTLSAPVNASRLLIFATGTGGVTQTAAGTITVNDLAISSVGAVDLTAANAALTIAADVTGAGSGFSFRDSATHLTVGNVTTSTSEGNATFIFGITTNDGRIALSTTTSGDVTANSQIKSNGGEIDIAVAPGSGFANNTDDVNEKIGPLTSINSGNGNIVILADQMTFAIDSTINAGSGTVVLGPATTSDNILLGGTSVVGTLGLQSSDLATITAGMVQIGYRAEDATASFTGAISIGGTGTFTVNGGTVPTLLLVTGGPSGTVTQTQPLSFGTEGGFLGVIAGGDVTLTEANLVSTVAGFTDNGSAFAFNNNLGLEVGALPVQQLGVAVDGATGLVSSAPMASGTGKPGNPLAGVTATGGGSVTIETSTGGLTLNSNVTAIDRTVTLISAGTIDQTAGVITAATLTGSSVGGATLTDGNAVGVLGPFSDTGTSNTTGLSFTDGQALQTSGVVSSTGQVTLTTTTGGITLGGDVTAGAGTQAVTLSSAGGISQTGGVIDAGALAATAAGPVSLLDANTVPLLGAAVTGSGNEFLFRDNATPLTVLGGISTDDGRIALSTTNSGNVVVESVISSAGGEIDIAVAPGSSFSNIDNPFAPLPGGINSANGNIVVLADAMTLGSTIKAGTGTVVLGPATTDDNILLGGASTPGTLGLQTSDLATITAGAVEIGYRAEDATPSFTGSITIGGTAGISLNPLNVPTLLLVTGGSAGTISQTQPLSFAGGTLGIISGGNVTLTGANLVGTLAGFADNASAFAFDDNQALTVGTLPALQLGVAVDATTGLASSAAMATGTGKPGNPLSGVTTAAPLTLTTTTGGLTLDADVTATGSTATLNSAGTITQPGGVITAFTLTGSSVGGATLTKINAVGTLGPFDDTGIGNTTGFSFTDGQALNTTGVVSSTGPLTLTTTVGGLTLGGDVTASGQTVTLASAGAITQTAGSITAATLTGSSVDGATLTLDNAVGTLGPFSDTGIGNTTGLSFTDGQALNTTGVVSSTGPLTLTTTTGGLTLGGDVTAAGQTVTLASAGAITQTGGSITAATLTGSSVDGATLTLDNAVGILGPFSDTGIGNTTGLSFTDGEALSTTGAVSSTGPLTLTTTVGGLTLGGDVTAAGQTVTLNSAGAISQTGGLITAATLTGSSVDGATLTLDNAVGTLGPFSDTGPGNTTGLSFTDGQALNTAGVVSSTGPLTLTTTSGGLTLGGALIAAGRTVTLVSAGQISQTAGSITGATLAGSSIDGATLTSDNAVGTLGPFSDTGADNTTGFSLTDGQALRTAGLVSSTGPLTLTTTTGGLTLGGDVTATGQTVTLNSAGTIDQIAGVITAATLTGGSVDGAILTDGNAVGTLGPFSDTGTGNTTGFSFTDAQALLTAGLVSSTGPLTLTTTTGGLTLGGDVTATGQTVTLSSAGAIDQIAGLITAATLIGSSVDGATLTDGNAVGTLGSFTDTGTGNTTGFSFADGQALLTAGLISSTGPLTLTTTIGGLTLGGGLTAAGQTVTLISAGPIDQIAGLITAGTLTGSSVDGAILTDGNAVGTLGPFTDTGPGNTTGLSFTDGQALLTAGLVSSTGPLTLTTTTGGLTLGGSLTANGQTVTLTSAGPISQIAGLIAAATLTGSSVGGVTLTDGNAVGTLGPFSDSGTGNATGLSFTDGQALQIAGPVSSTGPLVLTTTAGDLTLNGDVTTAGQTVTLTSAGAIDQTSGVITAAALTGSSAGDTALTQGNLIGTLGQFTVGNSLALFDASALIINGPITANFLTITATGRMTLAGNIATIGAPLSQQGGPTPAPGGSTLQVVAGAGQSATFVQTGTVMLTDPPNTTLRIQLPATNGTASFANLDGPGANLVLGLGTGTATGTMEIGGLLVLGQNGSATLVGSIDGVTTKAAAALGQITPATNPSYTFNGCEIAVLGCTTITTPPGITSVLGSLWWFLTGPWLNFPPAPPQLNLVVLTTPPVLSGQLAPADVVPPNISFEDY